MSDPWGFIVLVLVAAVVVLIFIRLYNPRERRRVPLHPSSIHITHGMHWNRRRGKCTSCNADTRYNHDVLRRRCHWENKP